MSLTREILTGLIAGVVMVIIVIGGLGIAITESQFLELSQSVAQAVTDTPVPTLTSTPIPTQTNSPTIQPTRTQTSDPSWTPSLTPEPPTLTPTNTLTMSPTPPENCPPPSDWESLLVQPGDTLDSIAETYDITVDELKQANCLITNEIIPGSLIYVPALNLPTPVVCGPPAGWVLYRIQSGDNLFRIAQAYGVTLSQLRFANCMGNSSLIVTGDYLYVPNVQTNTPVVTATRTDRPRPQNTRTNTPVPPTSTPTSTPVPATLTPSGTPTASNTAPPPTATPSNTVAPPTETTAPPPTDTTEPAPSATNEGG